MKAVMLSKQEADYVDHHLVDGFDARVKGIIQLQENKLISLEESHELIVRASIEHVTLWRNFKMKLVAKTLCVFFALLFGYMQINGDDLDMRRSGRTRTSSSRSVRGRNGRRKGDASLSI
jgi:hypothetical protein